MECLQLSDHMMHYRYFYYYFCFSNNFNCFEVVLLVFKEFAKEGKTTEYGKKNCSMRLCCLLIFGYWFELEILYCDFTSV